MTLSPDLAITGGAQTGLTNPVYNMVVGIPPDATSRAWDVTSLGGTQTNVRTSVGGDPFQIVARASRYQTLPAKNPVNGAYPNIPLNRFEILGRKGVYVDSSNTIREARIRIIAELPAGCESADAVNVRALASCMIGLLNEESADYGDTLITRIY